jgi:hypothetical protein
MTDRYNVLTVYLEVPIRDDVLDATLIPAISQLRGVLRVEMGLVQNIEEHLIEMRVKNELRTKILDVLI